MHDRRARRHLLSAAGALDVDFRSAATDYAQLLRLTALICRGDHRQLLALFRLAVFNVAAANEDDHLKNVAHGCHGRVSERAAEVVAGGLPRLEG